MGERKRLKINLYAVEALEESEMTIREVIEDLRKRGVHPGPLRRLEVYGLGKLQLALSEIDGREA